MCSLLSRRSLLSLCGAAVPSFLASRARSSSDAAEKRIYLQPLGDGVADGQIAFVRDSLRAFFKVEVRLLDRVALPSEAYYPARRRHRAEKLLDFLAPRLPGDGHRILGITSGDISTTKEEYEDWGILGLATIDGRACVISSFRCRRDVTPAGATIRLGKVSVHEIGHTFGLEHCPNRGCLMEDAQGKVATSDREYDLCGDCRGHLVRVGYGLAEGHAIPWSRG